MNSRRKNRRKKKLAEKLAGPEFDEYADWYPKELAAKGKDRHWLGKLTPAERRQFDAELKWASLAIREDLPGPRRVDVIEDYF